MTERHGQIAERLIELERELHNMGLWHQERPSDSALASVQPFCVDTMDFPQWLQFVFIERMRRMVEQEQPLPQQCGLAPMAEEYFRGASRNARALIAQLEAIDRTLSNLSYIS